MERKGKYEFGTNVLNKRRQRSGKQECSRAPQRAHDVLQRGLRWPCPSFCTRTFREINTQPPNSPHSHNKTHITFGRPRKTPSFDGEKETTDDVEINSQNWVDTVKDDYGSKPHHVVKQIELLVARKGLLWQLFPCHKQGNIWSRPKAHQAQ